MSNIESSCIYCRRCTKCVACGYCACEEGSDLTTEERQALRPHARGNRATRNGDECFRRGKASTRSEDLAQEQRTLTPSVPREES